MGIGLALSGGGSKGAAHIGVIKALLENGADYEFVSKVTGKTIEEIKQIYNN